MAKVVREPIQVYLTPQERAELDQAASALGVSRSEALRRGIQAVSQASYSGALRDLADDGYVTPPRARAGAPPPRGPIAPLGELLAELASERADE